MHGVLTKRRGGEKHGLTMLDLDTIFDDDRMPAVGVSRSMVNRPALAEPEPGIRPDDLPADWRVWFEERAAVREYDGKQARGHAEAEALRETLAAMRAAGENLSDAT